MTPDVGQHDVMAFLATPAAHGPGVTDVDCLETHISAVFLAANRAYKLKRAVQLPYVDYSTLEARRLFCEKEVRLNRRTAPDLYRRAVPVTRAEDGTLAIGGAGAPVEWLVEMRRFDQNRLLDAVAQRHALDVGLATAIGVAAATLHAAADTRRDHGGAAAMQWVLDDNNAELSAAGAVIDQAARGRLYEASLEQLRRHGDLLDARRAQGWVRECHGDLHLGNLFLDGLRPVLFDCIEFNDDLSCIDVLYDLAFLVMDLLHRRLPAQANAALNAWLERLPQYEALPLLPLFLSCRAAIRAKVALTATAVASDPADRRRLERDATVYLDQALGCVTPGGGGIVAIGGLSGSGKSTLARRLAADLGRAPGAIILRSDVARKRRFGVDPTVRLPESAYDARVSTAVYGELTQSACAIARAGSVALVDAVFAADSLRQALRDAAAREGVPFLGLWLDAPFDVMAARLTRRGVDASDATVDVLRRQHTQAAPPHDWTRLDAARALHEIVAAAHASAAASLHMSASVGARHSAQGPRVASNEPSPTA